MDNTTSILHIWSNEIRSRKQRYMIAKNRRVGLSREPEQSQVPKRNLDRVVEDAAICVPRVVTEDRNRDPDRVRADRDHDRANRDHDRANRDRDRLVRNHDRIVRNRGLKAVLNRAIIENRQVDPSPGGEQGQDRILRRVRTTNRLADQSRTPEHVALGSDENRDPEVAPSPIIGIIIEASAIDRLPSSESHEQDHDPYHPNEDHAVVLGLCQNRQVVEVALGQELLPQMLTNRTSAKNPKNPFKKRQRRQRKQMKRINTT